MVNYSNFVSKLEKKLDSKVIRAEAGLEFMESMKEITGDTRIYKIDVYIKKSAREIVRFAGDPKNKIQEYIGYLKR